MFQTEKKIGIPNYPSTTQNAFIWRIWHGINYLIGGLTFAIGSMLYYPKLDEEFNGDVTAGWLYTIGSSTFLLADLTEWNHYRDGCIGYSGNYHPSELDQSCGAKFKRAELGINFFCSVTGSFLYLIGSIFFIPATNQLLAGEYIFMIGSSVIFLNQAWKCVRTFTTDEENPSNSKFQIKNILPDLSGFFVDFFAGLGGLCYLIGTYFFYLSSTNANLYLIAVDIFTCGGLSFLTSGLFMQYRYFIRREGPRSDDHQKLVEIT